MRALPQSKRKLTEPISKVDTLDIHFAKLLASARRHQKVEKRVLNVSMAPVLPLNLRQRGDVACSEGMRRVGPEDEEDHAWQNERAKLEFRGRHREMLLMVE